MSALSCTPSLSLSLSLLLSLAVLRLRDRFSGFYLLRVLLKVIRNTLLPDNAAALLCPLPSQPNELPRRADELPRFSILGCFFLWFLFLRFIRHLAC